MIPLSSVPPGQRVRIVDIRGGRGKLARIYQLGIRIGDVVEVIQNFQGPLIIAKGFMRIGMGRGIANSIMVEVLGR